MNKKNKLLFTSLSALANQIVAICCGFILPQLILKSFGSNANGLLQSISQFLSIISFMELGIGAIIQSALYKPLAENDNEQISIVVSAGDVFFKKISLLLIVYSFFLIVFFPWLVKSDFSWWYSATLVFCLGMSSFAQYFLGMMDNILLMSNQKGYVIYISQILSLSLNALFSVLLIKMNYSIQIVTLASSAVFLLRPVFVRVYVKRHYSINRRCQNTKGALKQKWDGIMQHIAYIVLERTDIVVLTLFSTLSNVSIYSIYHLVVYGVKNIFMTISHGFLAVLGEIWAKNDKKKMDEFFSFVEYFMHSFVVLLFSCAAILILPFISIYLNGVSDANYIQPLFSFLIILAHALHCIRTPYHQIIKAAGDYKRTKSCFIYSAFINLVISVFFVKIWGLVGVAIGTLVAMFFQTVWMVIYVSKHLIHWPMKKTIKAFFIDSIAVALIFNISNYCDIDVLSYLDWTLVAGKTFLIAVLIILVLSLIFYKKEFTYFCRHIRKNG